MRFSRGSIPPFLCATVYGLHAFTGSQGIPLPHHYFLSRVMLPLSAFEEQWCFAFGFVQGLDREAMENALARAEMRAKTPSVKIAARAVRSLKKKIARIAELEGRQDSGKSLSADQVGPLTFSYLLLPSYLLPR